MARRARYDVLHQQTFVQLQTLPNVGPATAGDLIRLGVASLDDLSRRDPKVLYDHLTELDGVAHDPCVLDTFAAAIHAARTGEAIPWWEFSDARKAVDAARRPRARPF
ncbi:MAG: helix-hairpin-helix domain-containing protein [Thermoplasmatota archaeon]